MTPQTRKQKSQSMINHCDERQNNTKSIRSAFYLRKDPSLETLSLGPKGLTTIPVRTPFFREGTRHLIPSNLYYRVVIRTTYQNRMISLFILSSPGSGEAGAYGMVSGIKGQRDGEEARDEHVGGGCG